MPKAILREKLWHRIITFLSRPAPKNVKIYHESPIKILQFSIKNLWLLIFPLLRSLRFVNPLTLQSLIDWGKGVWFDILIAAAILALGALRWWRCRYYFDDISIHAQSGVFVHVATEIPFARITATAEEHPLYLRPFHAARLQISTAAGIIPESNLKLVLSNDDILWLREQIPVIRGDADTFAREKSTTNHVSAWYVLLFSALFSSSFSGAFYLAVLLFQGGRVFSDLFVEFNAGEILEDAADRVSSTFETVPRVGLIVGIVILSLWLVSFGHNLLRYSRFSIRFGDAFISIHMGVINRRRFHLRDQEIIFSDMRQNLIMKIFGVISLHIRCPGYGGRNDTLPVLIPLAKKKQSRELLTRLHAGQRLAQPMMTVRANYRFLWYFIWKPVTAILIVVPIGVLAIIFLPQFRGATIFFFCMILIPLLWALVVQIVAMFHQYFAINDTYLQLHFSCWLSFHTITVRRQRIVRMDMIQTPVQRKSGICRLYITMNGTRRRRYKLTAVSEVAARQLIQNFCGET